MTRKEAIAILEDNKPSIIFEDEELQKKSAEVCVALEMAISALGIECEWAKMTYDTNSIENKIIFEFSDGTEKHVTYTEEIRRTTVGE